MSKIQEQQEKMMEAMKEQFGDEVEQRGMGFTFSEEGFVRRGWRVGEAGRLTVWSLPPGRTQVSWGLEAGPPYLLACAGDGNGVASVGKSVSTWDVGRKRRLAPGQAPDRWLGGAGFSPQGMTVLVPQEMRGPSRVWDTVGNQEVRQFDVAHSWGP